MIELQVINKVLQDNSLLLLRQHNIPTDYFVTYYEEMKFIENHYNQYGNVPDKETFIDKFNDFDILHVNEQNEYLIEKLVEQYVYNQMVPFVHKVGELVTEDSTKAVTFVKNELERFNQITQTSMAKGSNIVKDVEKRQNEYDFRLNAEGLLGVPTGIDELDELTHGWLTEELIIILGRTNEGKSWVLMYFLVAAWIAKIPVLMYSGEMSEITVGFRFDTLYKHFSNSGLMSGKRELGTEGNDIKTNDDYFGYLKNLGSENVPFIVVTPKDLGGKRLTISTLHQLIETHKPGIVGIDQLSLMDDERAKKGEQTRMQYTHIAEDLYLTSEKYQLPILSPAQAKRGSNKKEGENGTESEGSCPDVEDISESDGIGQNATRVIGMRQIDMTLKLAIQKNRYGSKKKELIMLWDIDKGIVKPFMQANTDAEEGEMIINEDQMDGEELF